MTLHFGGVIALGAAIVDQVLRYGPSTLVRTAASTSTCMLVGRFYHGFYPGQVMSDHVLMNLLMSNVLLAWLLGFSKTAFFGMGLHGLRLH